MAHFAEYITGGFTLGECKVTQLWSSLSNYTCPQTQTLGHLKYDCWWPTPITISNATGNITYAAASGITNYIQSYFYSAFETEEQRVIREAAEAESARKRIQVNNRAEELMFLIIGEERKQQYIEKKYFDVQVNGRTYRVHRGRSKNIDVLENGEVKEKLCIHPAEQVPDPDTMLAQFLALTTDEKRFLATANKWAA